MKTVIQKGRGALEGPPAVSDNKLSCVVLSVSGVSVSSLLPDDRHQLSLLR